MTEFRVPDLGAGLESADVLAVLVSQGDTIQSDQPVLELESDKTTFLLPCPQAGRVAQVHVAKGDEVRVGQVVLTLEP